MSFLRRLLAYCVCVAVASPPLAYGQAVPAPSAQAAANQPGMRGVVLSGMQTETYARLMIKWPAGTTIEANASLNGGMALIRSPRALEVDPAVFARSAPQFIAAAALSADKRTIRLALVQPVRIGSRRSGDTQAFDLIKPDADNPPAFSNLDEPTSAPSERAQAPSTSQALAKMVNSPAPVGAPRVEVQAAVSADFTRLRLTNTVSGASLPAHGYARTGDRMAIAIPGQYALDIASLRTRPPARIRDSARYSAPSNTALVLDLDPGSVVRHTREGDAIIIDILPPGANPNSVEALQAQAAANIGKASTARQQGVKPTPPPPQVKGASPAPEAVASTQPEEMPLTERPDPAPSGLVKVSATPQGEDIVLEFGFDSPAPAVIYRRGDSIYALFATPAQFEVSSVKPSGAISAIIPVKGQGVSGVRITAPPQVLASPRALGGKWRVTLGKDAGSPSRGVSIERETAADGTGRVKALVPDSVATGELVDPVVGDTLLLGLALGPATPLTMKRSYLEAALPETFHGLVVAPRTEDFELRRALDGFVLVRPNGMALSEGGLDKEAAGLASEAPGYVDHDKWRLGPKADYMRNLDRLRRAASAETDNPTAGIAKRLDLARFLIAWDLGAEAVGVLGQLRSDAQIMAQSPEVIALEGIAHVLMGHGKQALDLLSQPEVDRDPASQLWAGLAAQMDGNPEEAKTRFDRGASALAQFAPQQRASFQLAHANAALDLGDVSLASTLAGKARDDAGDMTTKWRAQLLLARALAGLGQTGEALASLALLETVPDREVAARATYEKAIIGIDSGKVGIADSIRALDGLRYAWRGDALELDVLRRLGGLYITSGNIRSGLTTMTAAASLRPDLPAARKMRDELYKQFTYLFLEGGADGLDPIQALALFYDFKDLAPIGPEGDRMVRGLADRLVALDLLPQATALLQHQVDNRLDGFSKAQVATDLAALYLMDRRAEPALQAIWNSRVTQLPEALNAQRRIIEAAALGEIGRTDHALELIEFDTSPDASRLRAELYTRAGDWPKAAQNARATLPAPKSTFEPEEAGEVLRAAITTSMAGDKAGLQSLVNRYTAPMGKSAYAEAFKVIGGPAIPDQAALRSAVASITGGSPYNAMMKRLRTRLTRIAPPPSEAGIEAAQKNVRPTDGNANPTAQTAALVPERKPEVSRPIAPIPAPRPARVAQASPPKKRNTSEPAQKQAAPARVQAPRDPAPPPVMGR